MTIRLFLICLFLTILGCKSEDPTPELRDPIYSDLVKRAADYLKAAEDEEKKLEGHYKNLAKIEVRTIEARSSLKEIEKSKASINRLRQLQSYYEIKSKLRLGEARRQYRVSMQKDQLWPDPSEYEWYKKNIELREHPAKWARRAPKSTMSDEELLKSQKAAGTPAAGAELTESGGGGH